MSENFCNHQQISFKIMPRKKRHLDCKQFDPYETADRKQSDFGLQLLVESSLVWSAPFEIRLDSNKPVKIQMLDGGLAFLTLKLDASYEPRNEKP